MTGSEGAAPPEAELTRALYERFAQQIFRYCLHQLGSREEAEDAVQSTFLNAFRGLKRGVVPEAETAWLFKIAHNVCLSRHRSTRRRGRVESPADFAAVEELTPAAVSSPDELFGLQDVLEQLPENQRRAILLREWQGLSYREIARELDVSQPAVETLIFRARRALASGLQRPPERSARTAARAADWGNVLAALKSLLAGGGAAAKVAATVAAVGVTTVVATEPLHRPLHRPHRATAPAAKAAPASRQAPRRAVTAPPAVATAPVPRPALVAARHPAAQRAHARRPERHAAPRPAPAVAHAADHAVDDAPPAAAVAPPAVPAAPAQHVQPVEGHSTEQEPAKQARVKQARVEQAPAEQVPARAEAGHGRGHGRSASPAPARADHGRGNDAAPAAAPAEPAQAALAPAPDVQPADPQQSAAGSDPGAGKDDGHAAAGGEGRGPKNDKGPARAGP